MGKVQSITNQDRLLQTDGMVGTLKTGPQKCDVQQIESQEIRMTFPKNVTEEDLIGSEYESNHIAPLERSDLDWYDCDWDDGLPDQQYDDIPDYLVEYHEISSYEDAGANEEESLQQSRAAIWQIKREWYRQYRRTDDWITTRDEAVARANGHCQSCRSQNNLHVHHRKYDRIFREHPDDLEVLCAKCHEQRHGISRPKRDEL